MWWTFILHAWVHPIYIRLQLGFSFNINNRFYLYWYILSFMESKIHPVSRDIQMWGHRRLILIIHGFHICKFAYFQEFICNPKISIHSVFIIIQGHVRSDEKFKLPAALIPTCSWAGDALHSCFLLSGCEQVSFSRSIRCHTFCVFVSDFAVWDGPKHSAEVLVFAEVKYVWCS